MKILIADDMPEIASHFSYILQNEMDFDVVGSVNSGEECIQAAMKLKPDIILMDIQMETDDAGFVASRAILEQLPDTKIIILTAYNNTQNILDAFESGAADFIEKSSSIVEIINTIKEVSQSKTFTKVVNRAILDELISLKKNQKNIIICTNLLSPLSTRDINILKQLCAGKKYKEIAADEYIEEVTVRSKINKISKKIGNYSIRDLVSLLNSCNFFELLAKYSDELEDEK